MGGDNDPLLKPEGLASGSPVKFEWEAPYLVCWDMQFKRTARKHYVGIAQSHGNLFCAWDANKCDKYKWNRDGDTFIHMQHASSCTRLEGQRLRAACCASQSEA